jgi:hypothetical protein
MVKVNNSDKVLTLPLTRGTLPTMSWFEYHGCLYLAFEWQHDASFNPVKTTLRAVCFDPNYGPIESLFTESSDFLVRVVYDKDVTIDYCLAKRFTGA